MGESRFLKICPNCGYYEDIAWRPRKSRVFVSYVKADTLKFKYPALMEKILGAHPKFYSDGHFTYHLTKGGNVEKIENELFEYMGLSRDGEPEKIDHSLIKRLTDFIGF